MTETVIAHFVTFYSPGTFLAETSVKPIDAWDVDKAVAMAAGITERYNATPYGFKFSTRARGPDDLDSKTVATSATYYIGGKVETFADIEGRNDPKEAILLSNMRCNDWSRIWSSTRGWKWTQPLKDGDVVLPDPLLAARTDQAS